LPSPRHLAWLATRLPHEQSEETQAILAHIGQDQEVARVLLLVARFGGLVRERAQMADVAAAFTAWLNDARQSGIRAVTTFAAGLTPDRAAVTAALTTPWSNAQTEGHVTKLKLLKRQMYGRASFELLRRRVLLAAKPHEMRESRQSGAASPTLGASPRVLRDRRRAPHRVERRVPAWQGDACGRLALATARRGARAWVTGFATAPRLVERHGLGGRPERLVVLAIRSPVG
jgi:hypothetical protein